MQDQDMKALVRGFVKWLLRIGLGLNLILWLAVMQIYCQEKEIPHSKQHTDRAEWEDNIGIKFVTVTSKDDRLIYFYQVLNKMQTKISSLGWDSNSRLVEDASVKPYKYTGCFVAFYCKKHLMIYLMQRVPCFDDDDIPSRL